MASSVSPSVLQNQIPAIAEARLAKFTRVDKGNVDQAVALVREALKAQQDMEDATTDLLASVYKRVFDKRYGNDLSGPINLRYFLASNHRGQILGLCGLFETIEDMSSATWMGWLCVLPKYRKNGVASAMVQLCIDRARRDGAALLRVESSNHPLMAPVNRLLDRMQFVGDDTETCLSSRTRRLDT